MLDGAHVEGDGAKKKQLWMDSSEEAWEKKRNMLRPISEPTLSLVLQSRDDPSMDLSPAASEGKRLYLCLKIKGSEKEEGATTRRTQRPNVNLEAAREEALLPTCRNRKRSPLHGHQKSSLSFLSLLLSFLDLCCFALLAPL